MASKVFVTSKGPLSPTFADYIQRHAYSFESRKFGGTMDFGGKAMGGADLPFEARKLFLGRGDGDTHPKSGRAGRRGKEIKKLDALCC